MAGSREIKVSVNGADDNNKIPTSPTKIKKASPKAPKKKKASSNGAQKKAAAKPSAKNSSPAPAKAKRSKSGLGKLIGTALLSTLIVGGGIYIWQESVKEKTVEELSGQAREAKLSFEERIESLKRKLTGTETENIELKEKAMELEERVALLNKAKIDYTSEELSIGFTYPAIFGEIEVTETEIGSSTKLVGNWDDNEKLVFGGISEDYEPKGTSTIPEINELMGFTERRRDYYLLGPNGAEYEVNPVEVIDTINGKAILIDNKSFVLEDGEDIPVNIGQNVAFIVNLDNDKYSGLSFVNSDFGILPLESFIQLIESFEVIK